MQGRYILVSITFNLFSQLTIYLSVVVMQGMVRIVVCLIPRMIWSYLTYAQESKHNLCAYFIYNLFYIYVFGLVSSPHKQQANTFPFKFKRKKYSMWYMNGQYEAMLEVRIHNYPNNLLRLDNYDGTWLNVLFTWYFMWNDYSSAIKYNISENRHAKVTDFFSFILCISLKQMNKHKDRTLMTYQYQPLCVGYL